MRNHKVYKISLADADKMVALNAGGCLVCGKVFEDIGTNACARHCDRCGLAVVFGIIELIKMHWVSISSK